MKDKRILLGVLALLALLVIFAWKFMMAGNRAVLSGESDAASVAVEKKPSSAAPGPKVTDAVEAPKIAPVKAGGKPLDGSQVTDDNDFGDVVFTGDLPVVRTLSTGETCVIFAQPLGSEQTEVQMEILKSTGSLLPSNAELAAMHRPEMMTLIDKIDTDESVDLVSAPKLTVQAGSDATITMNGGYGDTAHFSIHLKPIVVPLPLDENAASGSASVTQPSTSMRTPTQVLPAGSFRKSAQ